MVFYEAKSFVGKPRTRKKLGSRKGTVPKFGKKTFEVPWMPTEMPDKNWHYCIEVENTFLQLDGGQTETVKVMFEGTRVDDLLSGEGLALPAENKVSIEGLALDPRTGPTQSRNARGIGGVGAEVETGVATAFDAEAFGVDQGGDAVYVNGKVRVTAGSQAGQGVKGGSVVVMFRQKGRGPADAEYRTAAVAADGTFSASWGDVAIPWDTVWAYYVPAPGYADCEIKKRMP